MKISLPEPVYKAINMIYEAGYSAYAVGGAVRDALMGLEPHDWDVNTNASPQKIEEIFSSFKIHETGIKHGTVTLIIDNMPLEITTFRTDGDYSDNRRPDNVSFVSDLKSDLSRRDFTCNALAYNETEGFFDYFGGIEDIKNKTIRCVGEPDIRFNEDSLRILRALRFSSVLNFEIDEKTKQSLIKNRALLKNISAERIFAELQKILCGDNVKTVLSDYKQVIFEIIPELAATDGCSQNHIRHIYDVWGHTVNSLNAIQPEPHLRLAMLFHDIGKPFVKTTDENGTDHFYNHAEKSAEIAGEILHKFKSSNALRNKVVILVEHHGFLPDEISKKTYKRYINEYGIETVKEFFKVRKADISAQNPIFYDAEIKRNEMGLKIIEELLTEDKLFKITDLDINGNDIIALGYSQSPEIGKTLNILFEEVADGKLTNEKNILISRAKEILC